MAHNVKAFGNINSTSPLGPIVIPRRDVGTDDVEITIMFCGVCHSDLHTARNEWKHTVYPCVPGHEIVGKVTKIGSTVTRFKLGDITAVGCLVGTCRTCTSCSKGLEQYCTRPRESVGTYNSPDPQKTAPVTYGGYSQTIIVNEHFVFKVPQSLSPAGAAPLLCAGITLYSPLKHWGASPGKKVGIVGLGGLGHMGVKLSHALGAYTVLFTTSANKVEDGKRLGADEVVLSKNEKEMKKHINSFNLIIDTVSVSHNLDVFTNLLAVDGCLVLVGAPEFPHPSPSVFSLLNGRKSIAGSGIGGVPETQEMLDFCAKHNIVADVEVIPIQKINEAYERLLKADVKYRFVIDLRSLQNNARY